MFDGLYILSNTIKQHQKGGQTVKSLVAKHFPFGQALDWILTKITETYNRFD